MKICRCHSRAPNAHVMARNVFAVVPVVLPAPARFCSVLAVIMVAVWEWGVCMCVCMACVSPGGRDWRLGACSLDIADSATGTGTGDDRRDPAESGSGCVTVWGRKAGEGSATIKEKGI